MPCTASLVPWIQTQSPMKNILTLLGVLLAESLFAQVSTYPYVQSFEEPFTYGHNTTFLPNWWGNYVAVDTLGQYAFFGHTGSSSLFFQPEGEEFKVIARVMLDLTGTTNTYADFWVATRKNGGPDDMKRVKLSAAVSIDGGITFPWVMSVGPHEGFPNENTDFQKYTFVFPPSTNNQPSVTLQFMTKSGGGPHRPGTLLLDDVMVTQAESDIFPPYIMGSELAIPSVTSFSIPFSEPLLPDSALLPSHYVFSWPVEEDGTPIIGEGPLPQVSQVVQSASGYAVTLTLDPPLSIGDYYALSILNMTDLNGNVADTLLIDGIVYNNPPPGSLTISEVMFNDPSGTYPMNKLQYVELYNPTTEVVPLGGLRIKGSIAAHDLPNVKLQPGEYWVATRNADSYQATFGKPAWEWKGSWIEYTAEEGETLEPQSLYIQTTDRHSGILVDSVAFDFNDSSWAALNKPGRAIEVCNALQDNLDPAHWSLAGGSAYLYTMDGIAYEVYGSPTTACLSKQPPVVNLGSDSTYCGVTTLTLDAGNPESVYLWSTGARTQTIDVSETGVYSVIVNNGGASATDTIEVMLVPDITATLGSVPESVCAKVNISFHENIPDAITWLWSFGDGTTSTEASPNHTYGVDGSFNVRLIVSNIYGCQDTTQTMIGIHPNKAAISPPVSLCQNAEATFTDNSTSAVQWDWTFGDGGTSTDQHPAYTYGMTGNYRVMLKAINSFGCTDTTSIAATVHGASVTWELPENFCQNAVLGFSDESPEATAWSWSFGDGTASTVQHPEHTYVSPGEYTVKLTMTNSFGCVDDETTMVTVKPNVVSWTVPTLLCEKVQATFSDTSPETVGWSWNFGDGATSTDKNPAHTYESDGDHTVMLSVTQGNGCMNTIQEQVRVNPNDVEFGFSPDPVCTYMSIAFTDNSVEATSWTWSFGDGVNSNTRIAQHVYTKPGAYTTTLTVTNAFGCTNSATQPIEVGICVGLEDPANSQTLLYPNPTKGVLTVTMDWSANAEGSIQILSTSGETAFAQVLRKENGKVQTIDLQSLPEGMYIVRLQNGAEWTTRKLIVDR